MDNEFSQKLFRRLLMSLYHILDSANILFLLSKELLVLSTQGTCSLVANVVVQDTDDKLLRWGNKHQILATTVGSRFQQQDFLHLSYDNINIFNQLALSGYPPSCNLEHTSPAVPYLFLINGHPLFLKQFFQTSSSYSSDKRGSSCSNPPWWRDLKSVSMESIR